MRSNSTQIGEHPIASDTMGYWRCSSASSIAAFRAPLEVGRWNRGQARRLRFSCGTAGERTRFSIMGSGKGGSAMIRSQKAKMKSTRISNHARILMGTTVLISLAAACTYPRSASINRDRAPKNLRPRQFRGSLSSHICSPAQVVCRSCVLSRDACSQPYRISANVFHRLSTNLHRRIDHRRDHRARAGGCPDPTSRRATYHSAGR